MSISRTAASPAPEQTTIMAKRSDKFTLWCEFEELGANEYDPANDHSDIFVSFSDGRKYLLKVWTYAYVMTVADGKARPDTMASAGPRPVDSLVPPDLLVRRLERPIVEKAIREAIKSGELDFSDESALLADPDEDDDFDGDDEEIARGEEE